MPADRPNILFVMTDEQRADTIAALGNDRIHTPNMDRLVHRGVSFTNAYTTCPVCVPARYTIRTGREPLTTAIYRNRPPELLPGQDPTVEGRCGPYLARTMTALGYRTFGIGKFHTSIGQANPWNEDLGYETHLHSEELYLTAEQRRGDAYARFLADEHPEYAHVEQPHGERTEMFFLPQVSPLPAELTVEAWAADRAIEQIRRDDDRPWFGFVSFIGPHPPCAPPVPFNRMYDPEEMPAPVCGDPGVDHMDDEIPWRHHGLWADAINEPLARVIKARYYGEITYIDHCLGRILDAVDDENTLIVFFSDHGECLGDHHAWGKECYFEASCRVPFVVSWPARLGQDVRSSELVCLTDLFGIATSAARAPEPRDGVDLLRLLAEGAPGRTHLFGVFGEPGTPRFKIMVRHGPWKYIFMANGGREQLFNVAEDPNELAQRVDDRADIADALREAAVQYLQHPAGRRACDGDQLRRFPFEPIPRERVKQFDLSRGIVDFPDSPNQVV